MIDDPTTRAVLKVIADAGFNLDIGETQITATSQETGERFIVKGNDHYSLALELACQVGIDLEDG
mgnify:CR=1 FL=1